MFSERSGDLFAFRDLDALAHGCNCAGVMGGGIAWAFAQRYPGLREAYQRACADGGFRPGGFLAWELSAPPLIYNLATQPQPGRCADLGAIRVAVQAMLADAQQRGLARVGMPRIGAGIGGLAWAEVEAAIRPLAERSPVELVVVSLPSRI